MFFNDTATTEIYTLSLHDALPISTVVTWRGRYAESGLAGLEDLSRPGKPAQLPEALRDRVLELTLTRSEEHTSELQSRQYLVCRLLLEKKKTLPPAGSLPRGHALS